MTHATASHRLAALSKFLGRPLPKGSRVEGVPNHFVRFPNKDGYAVVTMDEAQTTSYGFDEGRDATEADCVTLDEVTFIIFPYLATVTELGTEWLDLLAVRNEAPYGSAKYNRAEAKMEEIENKASMMVFNDTDHTMSECLIDPINPTEADRLNAFNYWLALICRDDADENEGAATVDGSTITDADGFTCWVLTRHEVKDAGLWYDDLPEVNYGGTSWVIMPL